MNRRNLLKAGLTIAGGSLLASNTSASILTPETTVSNDAPGHRRLGKLEVSSIGLGVQNMSRTYQTTIPSRPQMIDLIRNAYDQGITFFDTAEAYGPFECERILGEATASFRNKIVIETKFGWDIDPQTGRMQGGLNSKPEHIKNSCGRDAKTAAYRPY